MSSARPLEIFSSKTSCGTLGMIVTSLLRPAGDQFWPDIGEVLARIERDSTRRLGRRAEWRPRSLSRLAPDA